MQTYTMANSSYIEIMRRKWKISNLNNHSLSIGKTFADILKFEIENNMNQYFESLYPIALGILPNEIQKPDYSEKKGAL